MPRLPVDRRYSGRMSSPWWRRLPSDVALAASALVPWAVVLFQGLVIAPITYVDSSLLAAYDEIAPAWGTVGSLPITLVLGLIAGSFAAWRVSRPASWAWDRPYSLWRTAKWCWRCSR